MKKCIEYIINSDNSIIKEKIYSMERFFKYVKLIFALMYKDYNVLNNVKKILIENFGEIDFESDEYDFDIFTNYYEKEFGKGLKKRLISFENLIDRERIVDIKIFSMNLEERFSRNGRRQINIDPGYITETSLILTSKKERPHRIYLSRGVFAEVTLLFGRKSCINLPWTFPDYKTDIVCNFLIKVRRKYLEQIKIYKRKNSS